MNAPTLSRSCAHSGVVVGLEHRPLACRGSRLSSINSASRRTGTYFHWLAATSAPSSVRAPQAIVAVDRERAQAVEPERVEHAVLGVGQPVLELGRRRASRASVPAGAFHTPRCAVGAGDQPGHGAAGANSARPEVVERVRRPGCAGSRRRRSGPSTVRSPEIQSTAASRSPTSGGGSISSDRAAALRRAPAAAAHTSFGLSVRGERVRVAGARAGGVRDAEQVEQVDLVERVHPGERRRRCRSGPPVPGQRRAVVAGARRPPGRATSRPRPSR